MDLPDGVRQEALTNLHEVNGTNETLFQEFVLHSSGSRTRGRWRPTRVGPFAPNGAGSDRSAQSAAPGDSRSRRRSPSLRSSRRNRRRPDTNSSTIEVLQENSLNVTARAIQTARIADPWGHRGDLKDAGWPPSARTETRLVGLQGSFALRFPNAAAPGRVKSPAETRV